MADAVCRLTAAVKVFILPVAALLLDADDYDIIDDDCCFVFDAVLGLIFY
jgi:hypothetical protein